MKVKELKSEGEYSLNIVIGDKVYETKRQGPIQDLGGREVGVGLYSDDYLKKDLEEIYKTIVNLATSQNISLEELYQEDDGYYTLLQMLDKA